MNLLAVAYAQTVGLQNPIGYKTIGDLIIGISRFFVAFSASVATLMILYGAWKILTSKGEAHEIEEGKNAIWYTIVGFVIIVFAAGLVSLIVNFLGVNSSAPRTSNFGNSGAVPRNVAPRPIPTSQSRF